MVDGGSSAEQGHFVAQERVMTIETLLARGQRKKEPEMKTTVKLGMAAIVLALTASPLLAATDTYGAVISTLQSGSSVNVGSLATSNVNVVAMSSIKANGNTTALDNALKKNSAGLTKLRSDIALNSALAAKITAAGYKANQVIAVQTGADGAVTIYVDDRS